MLILTTKKNGVPTEVFVAAENIAHYWLTASINETALKLRDESFFHVLESPMTIARMRAAWDARFLSSQVHANNWLPIAVAADDKHGFRFVCCAYTDSKVQAKAAGRHPEAVVQTG